MDEKQRSDLRVGQSLISTQLECMRRLQQITDGLRQLRESTLTARFAREDEDGYIRDQQRADGDGYHVIPKQEDAARSNTLFNLNYIEDELDELVGHLHCYGDEPDALYSLSYHLDSFQKTVREEVREAYKQSLNRLALSSKYIANDLDLIRGSIYRQNEERERHQESVGPSKETPAWVVEKKFGGKLPLPD